MNKKKIIFILVIVIVIIMSIVVSIVVNRKTSLAKDDITYTLKQAKVESQTIRKELTSSMEVLSGLTEQIDLHATYYFSELCVEKNTYIKEGANLLKYTNGTYLKAPYDLVVTDYSLPEADEVCKNSHYIEVQTTETLSSEIEISESDMEYITLGKEVEVTINAFEETKYKGYITAVSETATDSKFSGTVTFINDGNIKLGMSGSCTILLQEAKEVNSILVEAVEARDDEKYVTVVNSDGLTSEVSVETGIANNKYVEIKSGLELNQDIQYKDVATGKTETTTETTTNSNEGRGQTGQMMMMMQ